MAVAMERVGSDRTVTSCRRLVHKCGNKVRWHLHCGRSGIGAIPSASRPGSIDLCLRAWLHLIAGNQPFGEGAIAL